MKKNAKRLVIATRSSRLALWQANYVKESLETLLPNCFVEILKITTEGDKNLDNSLAKIGGKGLFVKELEYALLDGRADLAVHSMKDLPGKLHQSFIIAAVMKRGDPRDTFVSTRYDSLESLPNGSKIGTSSLRRGSQILAKYPGLKVVPLRGNLETRLRKLDESVYDGIILAAAGLERLGMRHRLTALLDVEKFVPAAGQGAIGIECIAGRKDLLPILDRLNDWETKWRVDAERTLSEELGGSCTAPLGAFASITKSVCRLNAFVGLPDGSRIIYENKRAALGSDPKELGKEVAEELVAKGAFSILESIG